MEPEEFLQFGNSTLEWITNYLENIRERRVVPTVEAGYMRELIPSEAPKKGEKWEDVMKDIERVIMPGISHWQSPHFHAYYPSGNSYPTIVADMFSAGISCLGFSWMTSPAYTELEVITLDWLGKAIGLPEEFLSGPSNGKGGGVIHGSASEATLVSFFAARERKRKEVNFKEGEAFVEKLVSYTSDQAHSSVVKAALQAGIKIRSVQTDKDYCMRGNELKLAIQKDREAGLIPFHVVATLGTTSSCAFDALDEIGKVCESEKLWLHVDAAYAGAAFLCEEHRHFMKGIEKVDSFNFNPHKWMPINFDLSTIWFKNTSEIVDPFKVEAVYLQHGMEDRAPDFRHWQVPAGRRFRALKLWFVMRIYGLEKLQEHIRSFIKLAQEFEQLVKSDERFEVVTPAVMGITCFRLKGKENSATEQLLKAIVARGKIYMVPTILHGKYVIRFVVCSRYTTSEDVKYAWNEINEVLSNLKL